MSMRRTPSSGAGHDYSQGFGPAQGPNVRGYGGYRPAPAGSQAGMAVGFAEAVRLFYAKYARFSGRASRSEYWWSTLYVVLVVVGLQVLAPVIGISPTGEGNAVAVVLGLLLLAFWAGNIVPIIAVTVRRLHDVDLSGWFYLLGFVPFVGGLVLFVLLLLPPKPQGARFDH